MNDVPTQQALTTRTGSCGSCTFSTLRSDGSLLCCIDPPGWQRSISYAGAPPASGSRALALITNWPVVRSSDWCGQGADATTGLPFNQTLPQFTTVAKLPAPTPALAGARAFVTDAVTGHSVGSALSGGGTLTMPVYCSGSQWLAG